MKEDVRNFLVEYAEKNNWDTTDQDLWEIVTECGEEVYSELESEHRWWDEWFYVVKIEDKYIGYVNAKANRDESVSELGYYKDIDSICFCEPKEITTTIYKPI